MKNLLSRLNLTSSFGKQELGQELVECSPLHENSMLPLLMKASEKDINVVDWVVKNKQFVQEKILEHGGVLLRGFQVNGVEDFENLIAKTFGKLLTYSYASTPRSKVGNKVYTSTEYPAQQSIPLHNEMSYSLSWPMKIGFYCVQPALELGYTPIADSKAVYQKIDPSIRSKFEDKKIMYIRNYGNGLDLPWQQVFQTESKSELKKICDKIGIKQEWVNENHLRTYQTCQAVLTHPVTKEKVWFNQAHLFHLSNMKPDIQQKLLSLFEPNELPRNSYYGDGSEIEPSVLDQIRQIYLEEEIKFPWQKGDIMLLDNLLAAHGRSTFVGLEKY